ncbi:methyltransferase [Enterobacter sp. CC120223-11]|uniref:methyltransferase n=1 Tax=Enterobacter sp. CC120223-11 TaxID=1378073 RepID=UPI001C3EAE2E|nr:methyltransferase [Enterobacter sp. CC120223-11]
MNKQTHVQKTGINPHQNSFILHDLMYGHIYASALRAVVVHNIADLLAEKPLSAEELAQRAGLISEPLFRVLRFLSHRGLFLLLDNHQWTLTEQGRLLCENTQGSQRNAILLFTDEMFSHSAAALPETLRQSKPGFDIHFNNDFFSYLSVAPEKSRLFDSAMSALTSGVNQKIAESYPFPDEGQIIDIAGGKGGLLREILFRSPGLSGLLFDRPETVANTLLPDAGLKNHWQVEGGDIFQHMPKGGDIYLLKNILHDFSDADCLRILTVLRRAINKGKKLLVIEAILPDDGAFHPAVNLDVVMLMTLNGKERTMKEFSQLLETSGFALQTIYPTRSLTSVIEAIAM